MQLTESEIVISGIQSKITRHSKKQENKTYSKGEKSMNHN